MLHFDRPNYQYSMCFDNKDLDRLVVVGSCNGLVCLCYVCMIDGRRIHQLVILNPSIRKSLLIPEPNSRLLRSSSEKLMGFGFDSRTNDYKLLLAQSTGDYIEDAVLYSLISNSWKQITNVALKFRTVMYRWMTTPAFVNGRFHWPVIANEKNLLLVFDLRDDMFGKISLPKCLENDKMYSFKVKAFGESSIAVVHLNHQYESDIWVMKEYNSGEWMKLATIGKPWTGNLEVLEFRDDGEILMYFYTRECLALYNINDEDIKVLIGLSSKYSYYKICGYRHVESLALFDRSNDVSNMLFLATA